MEKYDVVKQIGKGSYGEVFLVRHKIEQKLYVLKKIHFSKVSEKEKQAALQEVNSNYMHQN